MSIDEKLDQKLTQMIDPIAQDNSSGSSELARRAAVALLDLLNDIDEPDGAPTRGLQVPVIEFAKRLLRAQPKMATLFNLVNRAILVGNAQTTFGESKAAIEKYIYNFLAVIVGGIDTIAQQAQPLITDGSVVLVHSFSGTVNKVLIMAKRQGRRFEVFCTESRPIMEGRKTAQVLSAAGIPVTFLLDASVALMLQRASLVILGADAVTSEGIVNKIGSTAIALSARSLQRPVYIVADSTKFLPSMYKLLTEDMHSQHEVWPDAPDQVLIFNRYFETTPLDLFAAIVTEHGILKVPEVKLHLTNLGVASELCAEF